MTDDELLRRYNYDAFVKANWQPGMQFDASPPLGAAAPDFTLWPLAGGTTTLSAVWSAHTYTIVEFGSFT
jgi:hypothetical protein